MSAQTIAVVGGTGAEGGGIALRLGHAGYRVIIGTRNPAKGADVAKELNKTLATAVIDHASNIRAAETAEIVILTVPYQAQQAIVNEIRTALPGEILIDATARWCRRKLPMSSCLRAVPPSRLCSRCSVRKCGWYPRSRTLPLTSSGNSMPTCNAMFLFAAMMQKRGRRHLNWSGAWGFAAWMPDR
jgi:NADP oxidoreductase coenzyme F420-dependent